MTTLLRPQTTVEALAALAFALMAVGAVYETCVALEIIPLGAVPGAAPPGEAAVAIAAVAGLLLGSGASGANAARHDTRSFWALKLLGPVAAAYVVARFYAFDPYYAPSLRRASEGGLVSTPWIALIVALSLGAAALAAVRPRLGSTCTFVVLLLCFFTALVVRLGH
ncbi:MAG: hypothetical protein H0U46_02065 [Actinobacteria bacterium]|nr:hypothetical protein [Actinomycetota bacterium]